MHYYKRDIGDYYTKAGRLSILEHGAYTLLLDACYDRERYPTREEAIDWCWARSADEIAAVDFVLAKFFTLTDDGRYVQARIQEEIDRYHANSLINKEIALKREASKREKKEHEACTKRERSVNEPPPNQELRTKNQELRTRKSKSKTPPSGGFVLPASSTKEISKDTVANLFEELWTLYPSKDGKKEAFRHVTASVKTDEDVADIRKALNNYLAHLQKHKDWKRPKNGSTWFNNWRDWVNWQEPERSDDAGHRSGSGKAGREGQTGGGVTATGGIAAPPGKYAHLSGGSPKDCGG